jgi:hypothetical protein
MKLTEEEKINKKLDNIQKAVSTVFENRLQIFLPLRNVARTKIFQDFKKNNNIMEIKTDWGNVEIRNRLLTQQHKDVLEMLLSERKIFSIAEKKMIVTINRYNFLKKLGKKPANYYVWLKKILLEIADMMVVAKIEEEDTIYQYTYRIIDKIEIKENKKIKELKIKFTEDYTRILLSSNLVNYKKYLSDLTTLKSYFLKSLIRYMLTNRSHKIFFETYIEKTGLKKIVSTEEIKKFKEILIEETEEIEKKFELRILTKEKDILIENLRQNKQFLPQKKV